MRLVLVHHPRLPRRRQRPLLAVPPQRQASVLLHVQDRPQHHSQDCISFPSLVMA